MFRSANNGFRIAAQSLPFGVAIELLFFHRLKLVIGKVIRILAACDSEPEISTVPVPLESLIDSFRADPHCVSRTRSERVKMGLKGS
jgi:hypothetical protein